MPRRSVLAAQSAGRAELHRGTSRLSRQATQLCPAAAEDDAVGSGDGMVLRRRDPGSGFLGIGGEAGVNAKPDRELRQPELMPDSRNQRFERSLGFGPLLSPLPQGQLGGG